MEHTPLPASGKPPLKIRVVQLEHRRQEIVAQLDAATIDTCTPARFLELLAERTLLDRTLGRMYASQDSAIV